MEADFKESISLAELLAEEPKPTSKFIHTPDANGHICTECFFSIYHCQIHYPELYLAEKNHVDNSPIATS